MNQTPNAQRPLLLAFLLGSMMTLVMGWLVVRMENSLLNQGTTGFEGVGGFIVIALSLLVACVVGVLMWVNSDSSDVEHSLQWSRLRTKGSMLYFFMVYLVGFSLGPTMLRGQTSLILLVITIIAITAMGIFLFTGQTDQAKHYTSAEEE